MRYVWLRDRQEYRLAEGPISECGLNRRPDRLFEGDVHVACRVRARLLQDVRLCIRVAGHDLQRVQDAENE